jgi:hypothetical protein
MARIPVTGYLAPMPDLPTLSASTDKQIHRSPASVLGVCKPRAEGRTPARRIDLGGPDL